MGLVKHADGKLRCAWCGTDPLYVRYHDEEWGVPVHDERQLFEMLCLEGAQAGLSWITVLRKRENYRRAFDDFDIAKIARYQAPKVASLMKDAGIVRNRLKVRAFIENAKATAGAARGRQQSRRAALELRSEEEAARTRSARQLPASTPESDAMSKALKKRGFKFVGTTICYAFMQAVGIVDDHQARCSAVAKALALSGESGSVAGGLEFELEGDAELGERAADRRRQREAARTVRCHFDQQADLAAFRNDALEQRRVPAGEMRGPQHERAIEADAFPRARPQILGRGRRQVGREPAQRRGRIERGEPVALGMQRGGLESARGRARLAGPETVLGLELQLAAKSAPDRWKDGGSAGKARTRVTANRRVFSLPWDLGTASTR